MGMTIDEHIAQLKKLKSFHNGSYGASINFALETMRKYQLIQADYEARLKADVVAMLEELKEELREMHEDFFETEHFDEAYGVSDSMDIIQQKINALKAESEDKE